MTIRGVIVGLIGAFAFTRLMASMLFGVRATDPLTFAAVAVLLSAISSCSLAMFQRAGP